MLKAAACPLPCVWFAPTQLRASITPTSSSHFPQWRLHFSLYSVHQTAVSAVHSVLYGIVQDYIHEKWIIFCSYIAVVEF